MHGPRHGSVTTQRGNKGVRRLAGQGPIERTAGGIVTLRPMKRLMLLPEQQNPSVLARAENAAKTLGQGSSNSSGTVSDLKSVYDKVTLAQSLLHKGDSTQAKSILDEIPTSPTDALKLLHR